MNGKHEQPKPVDLKSLPKDQLRTLRGGLEKAISMEENRASPNSNILESLRDKLGRVNRELESRT